MNELLINIFFIFIASAGFGFLFNAPKRMLVHCGLVGIGGWVTLTLMVNAGIDSIQATFCAGFVISLISFFLARWHKTPIIIFIVGGLIPLVPGGTAYDAMRHVVIHQYSEAIPLALKAFIISGAIAMGLVFAEVFIRLLQQMIDIPKKRKESGRV